MKTAPLTAEQTDKCPPHRFIINLEDVGLNGKSAWHQIGRCSKCHLSRDFGQVESSGKIPTVRSRATCAKGGKKRKKEVK